MWQTKTKINKRTLCFVPKGKKKNNTNRINYFIKVGLSHDTMINHVNKTEGVYFQTVTGKTVAVTVTRLSHGRT